MKREYQVQFAPDGEHWQTIKRKKAIDAGCLWDDFCFNPDYRILCSLNHSTKFRLINVTDNKVIGEFSIERR